MQNIKTNAKRSPKIATLILFSLLGALGCIFLGYIFLPFAAGMYASLLICEKKDRRIFSYALPIVVIALNFMLNGLYSLEAIAYPIVGFIIYAFYKKEKSKAESAFWITLVVFLFFILSLALIAFKEMKTISFSAIGTFYSDAYTTLKKVFIDYLTSMSEKNEFGITVYLYNAAEAEIYFIESAKLIFPIAVISAFLISGIALKTFSKQTYRTSSDNRVTAWDFIPSSFVAYFYLIISIISIVADVGILAETVFWIEMIFSVVFAYMGFKF